MENADMGSRACGGHVGGFHAPSPRRSVRTSYTYRALPYVGQVQCDRGAMPRDLSRARLEMGQWLLWAFANGSA
eukprot:2443489-Prymnesium_polylepis.1